MRSSRLHLVALFFLLCTGTLSAQLTITDTQELDLPGDGMWGYAKFSPDGGRIFYSTLSYDGIWSYDLQTRTISEITDEAGTGFGFAVSPDGRQVAFRRTIRGARWIDRTQEIVLRTIASGSTETLASARTISTPVFQDDAVTYVIGSDLKPAPPKRSGVFLQGVVDQKIMLIVNGAARSIDPLGNGSYIWPSLSPDRSRILAYDMKHGAVLSTLDGTIVQRLGRAEGPTWTRDGKWIVYFSEENDGYRVTGGELHAVTADGSKKSALTNSTSRIELFPSCSPTENKIICHTMDGRILILTYTVAP